MTTAAKKPKKAAEPAVPAKGKHLTPKQWAEVEALWEAGEITIEGLKSRFGKNAATFLRHFRKHSIKKGSKAKAHKAAVAEAVTEAASAEATVLAKRIQETKEEHYTMAQALTKLTWAEVLNARKTGVPFSALLNNLKALDSAMNVLKKAREERWIVLGLDKEDGDGGDLPELVIAELTADQISEIRDAQDEDDLELEGLADEPLRLGQGDLDEDELEDLDDLEEGVE